MTRLGGLAALLCMAGASASAQSSRANQLEWLAGCWEQNASGNTVTEYWTKPAAGILLGVGRTTRGDSTVSYEFMRIYVRRTRVIFEARPNGAAPVEFQTRHIANRSVQFRNPKNDFPQRVAYRHVSPDSIEAFIEGPVRGRMRRIDFAYKRVACEPATPSAP